MSDPQTLSAMLTEVRRRANMENAADFLPDGEITSLLNYNLKRLWNLLIEADADFKTATQAFNTVTNQSAYAVPGAFYKLRTLDCTLGGETVNVTKYALNERNIFKNYPWATGWPVRYRLIGNSINLQPTPTGIYSMLLTYYPIFVPLVNPGDTFDGVSGYEEYAIWKTVAYCLQKEESDVSYAEAQAAEIREDIRAMAATRDAGEPERSTDVYVSTTGWTR